MAHQVRFGIELITNRLQSPLGDIGRVGLQVKKRLKTGWVIFAAVATIVSFGAGIIALMQDKIANDVTCRIVTCRIVGLEHCEPSHWSQNKAKEFCDRNTLFEEATGRQGPGYLWILEPKKTYAACERAYSNKLDTEVRFQAAALAAGQQGAAKTALWKLLETSRNRVEKSEALSLLGLAYWRTSYFGENRKLIALHYLYAAASNQEPHALRQLAYLHRSGFCVRHDQISLNRGAEEVLKATARYAFNYEILDPLWKTYAEAGSCALPDRKEALKFRQKRPPP